MKRNRVLGVGIGRFGRALVETLWRGRAEVVAVDVNAGAVDSVKDRSSPAFVEDVPTQGSGGAQRRLGARYVVARAETQRQAETLETIGASRVLQEGEMIGRLGPRTPETCRRDLMELADDYRIVSWTARGPLVGRTPEAQLGRDYELMVLGYRAPEAAGARPRLTMATPEYVIREGDTLPLVGSEATFARFLSGAGRDR